MRTRLAALATAVGIIFATSAHAGHHLWDFTEIFSNGSGSVQYIEMFTAEANEQGVGPFSVTVSSHTFNFVTNLGSAATANTYLLIATNGYTTVPGAVAPDYIIPTNFFATGGGTLNYAGGVDVWSYGAVPTDGTHSLLRNGSTANNSPTNFAGQTGSLIGLAVPMVPRWGLLVLLGALLLAGSGLLTRRNRMTTA